MSKSSRKGATFEQQACNHASRRLGDGRIERRAKNGVNDRGDVAGIFIGGKRAVIECKNCKRTELAEWLSEAERERGNDDAEYGIVLHHRRGCGEKNFGRNYVTMEYDTLLAIIAGGWDNLED